MPACEKKKQNVTRTDRGSRIVDAARSASQNVTGLFALVTTCFVSSRCLNAIVSVADRRYLIGKAMHLFQVRAHARLWWRRQVFRMRRWSHVWLISALICILIAPSLFSSRYNPIPLNQDVSWDSIGELWQMKEKVIHIANMPHLLSESFASFRF